MKSILPFFMKMKVARKKILKIVVKVIKIFHQKNLPIK